MCIDLYPFKLALKYPKFTGRKPRDETLPKYKENFKIAFLEYFKDRELGKFGQ